MQLPFPGTLLNTATVVAGSLVGLLLGRLLPGDLQGIALTGIGLINIGMGVKMFLKSQEVLIVAGAIVLGGILGHLMGITSALDHGATTVQSALGAKGRFSEGLVTASILFCVGPMALLGCIQDAVEGRSELLHLKSTLDGIASVFLAATLGAGVLVSALVVLVFQGTLTLMGRRLRRLAEDPAYADEASAIGGMMILGIGLGLTDIKHLPVADYLPALVIGPALVWFAHRRRSSGKFIS